MHSSAGQNESSEQLKQTGKLASGSQVSRSQQHTAALASCQSLLMAAGHSRWPLAAPGSMQ